MASDGTLEKITNYLLSADDGVTSSVIAEHFLALKGGNDLVNGKLVEVILQRSPIIENRNGLWFAKKMDSPLLNEEPFLVCVPLLSNDRRSIIQISMVKLVGDDHEQLFSCRLSDSDDIISTRGELIVQNIQDGFPPFMKLLHQGRLLFATHYEQRLLLKYLLESGFSLPENTLLLSHIFKTASLPMTGKNDGINGIASNYISIEKEPVSATDYAKITADLISFLIRKNQENGIVTIKQFQEKEIEETLSAQWDRAEFTFADFLNLQEIPGVYGYKNEDDEYIYVGKGVNVRT